MLNECRSVRPWTVIGKTTRPGILALVPSAKCISPSSLVGRMRILRAWCAVSEPMMDTSDPVSIKVETCWFPSRTMMCGRGVNLTRRLVRAGVRPR